MWKVVIPIVSSYSIISLHFNEVGYLLRVYYIFELELHKYLFCKTNSHCI